MISLEYYRYLKREYGEKFAALVFDITFEFWTTCGETPTRKYSPYKFV